MWRTTGGHSIHSDFVRVSPGVTKTDSDLFVGFVGWGAKKMLVCNVYQYTP